MKALASLFRFSFLVAFLASAITYATGISFALTAPVIAIGHAAISLNSEQFASAIGVGINKELWLNVLMENFYPSGGWFTRSQDLSAFVEYDRLNWAIMGSDPVVYVNRDTLANPIPITPRTDTHAFIDLDTLDTANTPVTNVEAMELSYDKMATVVESHKKTLQAETYRRAAFAWCPTNNSGGFVISTTGATNAGHKRFVTDDLAALKQAWDNAEYPEVGRVLVLNSKHVQDLAFQDKELYKAFINLKTGEPLNLHGFEVYTGSSVLPRYNKSTLAKVAYGAAAAPSTDSPASSIAWIDSQVFRADGSNDMFLREKDPEIRADFVGFQKRFIAGQGANRGVGAIVTVV